MTNEEQQHVIDHEHLRLLSLFHYISGAITLVFSCLFILQLGFMLTMLLGVSAMEKPGHTEGPSALPFVMMAIMFGLIICAGIALGVFQLLSARAMARRERRLMTMIVAGPAALMMPYGTILSVMTWIVLSRPSVRALYGEPAAT